MMLFHNIISFEIKFKMSIIGTFKYFQNHKKHMTDPEIHSKPDVQILKMQFSSITYSTTKPLPSVYSMTYLHKSMKVMNEQTNKQQSKQSGQMWPISNQTCQFHITKRTKICGQRHA